MIPNILQYFVSGYIFIFIFKTICSQKVGNSILLINSCVLSFIFVSIIRSINIIFIHSCLLDNLWIIVLISIILSLITSIAFSNFFESCCFRKLLVKWFGLLPYSSVWKNLERKNAKNIKVYPKGKDFYWIGHLDSYEDNKSDPWFCIHKPQKFYIEDNKLIYNQGDNEDAYFIFNLKEIEFVEMFTSKESEPLIKRKPQDKKRQRRPEMQ